VYMADVEPETTQPTQGNTFGTNFEGNRITTGGDFHMHVRMEGSRRGITSKSHITANTKTTGVKKDHANNFGSWNVKETSKIGHEVFEVEKGGNKLVKRTVDVIIEKGGRNGWDRSHTRSKESKEAGHCMEVAYGMQVRAHVDIPSKVSVKLSSVSSLTIQPFSLSNKSIQIRPIVSCVHRQQTFCWISTPGTRAKARGVLVLSSVSATLCSESLRLILSYPACYS
jgi:hypothetical protein